MTKHNRRIFLRGLGGACVAAPFLTSLKPLRAQTAASGPPKRLIIMWSHYGVITTKWFPAKSHGALTAADLEPTTLKVLAPYVDKMLMPRGIRSMNEWTSNMSRGQGNDPHTNVAGSAFTCQPITPNSDDPFDFNMAKKNNAKPIGPSLDHVIAKQLSPGGSPLFMRIGNGNDSPMSAISYSAAEQSFPGYGLPSQAFSGLTDLFMEGQPMNPDTYAAIKGKSITDLVKDDLDTLGRFDMSATDRQKLEAWKALLNDMGGVMASAQCSEETAALIGATSTNVGKVMGGGIGMDITAAVTGTKGMPGFMDATDVYTSVAALAAVCNANPVILMKFPANYKFSGLGQTVESHSLSHRIGNAGMQGTCVPNVTEQLIDIDTFYATKFAHLVEMLKLVPEGDGTVLDNCAAVWMSEMSDGNAHNLNNLPIVQVGSMGGFFKQGMAINVEDGSATLSQGRSEAVCVDGAPTQVNGAAQTTGTEANFANAPINKYYVSLMNALGVKAGADGYATADTSGTAEVTKFGRYDKTEDFIHGNKESVIHSPGGFDDLKA